MQWDREPWRKLYRREEGSFALLPLYARSLGAELLKFADDDGRLFVGNREPWEAIARICGATTGDRRLLRMHIPMLLDDGYLVREGDYLRIRNMGAAQGRLKKRAEREPGRMANEPETTEQRTGTNGARTGNEPARTEHEPETKNASSSRNHSDESITGTRASEDQRRVDPIRGERIHPPSPGAGEEPSIPDPADEPSDLEQALLDHLSMQPPPVRFVATLEYARSFAGTAVAAGASLDDARDAITAAAAKPGDLRRVDPADVAALDAVADHVGKFLAKAKQFRLARGGPRVHPTDANAKRVRDYFGLAWARKTREPYAAPEQDLRPAAELWEAATRAGELAKANANGRPTPDAEAHLRHWIKRFLDDDEPSVQKANWPISWLPTRIGRYGAPRPKQAPPRAPSPQTNPPPDKATTTAGLAGLMAAIGGGGRTPKADDEPTPPDAAEHGGANL